MKKTYVFFIFLIVVLSFGVYVFAEDTPEIYNKGKKVEVANNLICQDGQYFIHADDLEALNLFYSYDETTKKGVIASNDIFGIEKKISFELEYQIPKISGLPDDIIIMDPVLPEDWVYDFTKSTDDVFIIDEYGNIVKHSDVIAEENLNKEEPDKIYNYIMDVYSYSKRNMARVGETGLVIDKGENVHPLWFINVIKLNGAYYFPINFIGEKMSHKYNFDGEKVELYIADTNSIIVENTVHLSGVAAASEDGWSINISFFEENVENIVNNELSIIYQTNYTTIPGEKEIKFLFDIPKEKIVDNTFYYMLDLGDRYAVLKKEYDFSEVGVIDAYPYQKDVRAKVKISLPEADSVDVPFKVGVESDCGYSEQSGVIKSGELSEIVEIFDVNARNQYKFYVTFNTNKYIDAYFGEKWFIGGGTLHSDLYGEYTVKKATEIKCKVSLPDGFVCKEDVWIAVGLGSHDAGGSYVVIADKLNNGNDKTVVVLNSEYPTAEVILYGTSNPLKLYYKLYDDVPGLKVNGYLGEDGWFEQKENYFSTKKIEEITENRTIDFSLLEDREIIISDIDGKFVFEKTNTKFDTLSDIYIAYYDESGRFVSLEKKAFAESYSYDVSRQGIKEVKAFVWEKEKTNPLGKLKSVEIDGQ